MTSMDPTSILNRPGLDLELSFGTGRIKNDLHALPYALVPGSIITEISILSLSDRQSHPWHRL